MASIGTVTVDLVVKGQPESCKKLHAAGWRFSYCNKTRFVSARHPLGGKLSVVEVLRTSPVGLDVDEIGNAIAMMLNGGNHQR